VLLLNSKRLMDRMVGQRAQHESALVDAHAADVDSDMTSSIPYPSCVRGLRFARRADVDAWSSVELPLRVAYLWLQQIFHWRAVYEKLAKVICGLLQVVVEREWAVSDALAGGSHNMIVDVLSG
jgi:hypothetical protein